MNSNTTERFVSLHGFFAFQYPSTWVNETDEAGHYIFYKNSGGQGVLRIMLMENEFEGTDAAKLMLEEVYKQNKDFTPELLATKESKFVYFVKQHEVSGNDFTVHYWATAKYDQVILFTFTLQTALKELPKAEEEKVEIESMIATFEFLSGEHHG